MRTHQGKGESCSSTGESGLGVNSNSMSGRTGAGGVIGHNSITGLSNSNSSDLEFQCIPLGSELEGSACSQGIYNAFSCNVMSSKQMLQHRLDGHNRYSALCPECVRGKLRARQHFRKIVGGANANPAGRSVSIDYSGPHTKGVAGGKYALVGVEMEHEWGYVGITPSRSSAVTLAAIQDLECEIKKDSGNHDIGIVSIHHDDDKSFRGEVETHAREKGWENTHTGGYRPNANSKCERRIGMLQQLFRVVLLVAARGVHTITISYGMWVLNTVIIL
jgi:hypothetical protein